MRRREGGLPDDTISRGLPISRNPGVTLIWVTKSYRIIRDQNRRPLFNVGEPIAVECYAEGRKATTDEIRTSVDTGLPFLLEIAEQEGERALKALNEQLTVAKHLLGIAA